MVVRWQVYDPYLGTEEFPLNPSEVDLPPLEKDITTRHTTANNKAVLFEGNGEPTEFKFNGVLFEEADYDWFVTWYNKKYQVRVTDDLGQEFWIYLQSFRPRRRRSFHHPWCIEYEAVAVIVDWS